MLRFELKKIITKRMNKILFVATIVLAVVFSIFAINGIRYIEPDGTEHKGLDSARLLTEQKNQWKGTLTPDVLAQVVEKDKTLNSQYQGEMGVPDDVYAKNEQGYMDISELINDMATPEGDYNPYALDGLDAQSAQNLYQLREEHIEKVIQEEATTPEQATYLKEIYKNSETPFQYEAPESWKSASLLGEEYGLVVVLLIGFLSAGIFADEFRYKADAIFFSTKRGKKSAIHAKIQAGLIMAAIVYWICMAVFTIISFSVMGISGYATSVQVEWCYSTYAITYGQYYLIIMLCGFIASILASSVSMLLSAKLHTSTIAASVPFILFCVSPFMGRALPFHTFFNLTPDQLMNVCNSVRNVVVYQIGDMVFRPIPFVMALYAILALVFLPITYGFYHRYTIKS